MNRLKEDYDGQVEFIELDVDDPGTGPMRDQYGLVAQAQYVLADADGAPLQKWFGYIDENDIAGAFDGVLG